MNEEVEFINTKPIKKLPNKPILSIFATILIFWFLIYILIPSYGSREVTLTCSSLAGLISLMYLVGGFVKIKIFHRNAFFFIPLAYLTRVIFGTVHYLISIDSTYFTKQTKFAYLYDYEWLNSSMLEVCDYWKENGFGILAPEFFVSNKNAIITAYMSLLYYLGGNSHFLNIVVLNSFHNILVSILVGLIGYSINGVKLSNEILLISLLQPFGFATDIFWRDSVGQFFVITSIALLLNANSNFKGVILIALSSFFTFLHRTAYVAANLIIYFYRLFILPSFKKNFLFKNILIVLFYLLWSLYGESLYELTKFQSYISSEGDTNTAISNGGSTFTFILGLVGPFPWQQIFYEDVVGKEYLFYDMLHASYCMVVYFSLFMQLFKMSPIYLKSSEKTILLSVLIYMSFGLFSYGHISYTTVASILLLTILKKLNFFDFIKKWFVVILAYISLSLIWGCFK